jgi:hypothetical protein
MNRWAFVGAVTLGAGLLFMVQPMLGRVLLPWFGGGATVWAVCLLFFQTALLLGYAYAHLLAMRLPTRTGIKIHAGLLIAAAICLPLSLTAPVDETTPTWAILRTLSLGVGLPYLALSATAPLVQAWAARVQDQPDDAAPYGLYAWSNGGSLGALLAYPIAVEPFVGVRTQLLGWSIVFGLWLLALGACARIAWLRGRDPVRTRTADTRPGWADVLIWISTTAVASGMLLAVTDLMAEQASAGPFMWVLPLSVYLISFILCFGTPSWSDRAIWLPLTCAALGILYWVFDGADLDLVTQCVLYTVGLFVCCMLLHGEWVRHRPAPGHLTGFYLAGSVGGALGGLSVAVIAPLVFDVRAELAVLMVMTAILAFGLAWRSRRRRPMRQDPVWIPLGALLIVVAFGWALKRSVDEISEKAIWVKRGFYGVLRVRVRDAQTIGGPSRRLLHGPIMHGYQFTDHRAQQPISYYGPRSGVARAIRSYDRPRRIGVVGLGVGTVAAFTRPQDHAVFYEISPDVVQAAREWFTYLSGAQGTNEVVLGDARRTLTESDERFDVLVLDAFTGDAIPAHLLTREALELCLDRLERDGTIVVNISNRHLDLRPVLKAHAEALGLHFQSITSRGKRREALFLARWVVLSRDADQHAKVVKGIAPDKWKGDRVDWTDDFAPIWSLLRAWR